MGENMKVKCGMKEGWRQIEDIFWLHEFEMNERNANP